MRVVATLALVVLSIVRCAGVSAEQSSSQPPQAGQNSVAQQCTPGKRVLGDGAFVIQNRDCSTTEISKDNMLKPPAEQTGAVQPGSDPSPQAAKLSQMKPEVPPAGEDDSKLRAKYLEAMNGYYDYYTAGYMHRQRVFEWQLLSSRVIFILVTFLVASGVYFAALQFYEGSRRRAADWERDRREPGAASIEHQVAAIVDPAVTTFSASAKGIEVSSPVLGIIILVISLAFFYLYLVYVYPITELF